MSKQPPQGPGYSRDREFTVVLEDLRGQFKAFGEGLEDVRHRVERIEEKVDIIEEDVRQVKSFLKPLTAQVSDHDRRITTLERRS